MFFGYMLKIVLLFYLALGSAFGGVLDPKCISSIQDLFDLHAPGQGAAGVKEVRLKIKSEIDYGDLSNLGNKPGKQKAFKDLIESLAEFCQLCGPELTPKGIKGYARFAGSIITSVGENYVLDIKKVFGGANFNAKEFNEVMELIHDSGQWISQRQWESPAGIVYSFADSSAQGHRFTHILTHSIDDATKDSHGVWNKSRKQIFEIIDFAWLNSAAVQDIVVGSMRLVVKNYGAQVGKYDSGLLGASVVPSRMTYVAYVFEGNRIISAFPVMDNFRF